jgi:hypothetical protein
MKTLTEQSSMVFQPPQLGCILFMPGLPGSGNKIYDRSPYGNIGLITSAVWKRLPAGLWYLEFDGLDDFIECASNASHDITCDITLKAWVYWTGTTDFPRIIKKSNESYGLWKQNNAWRFQLQRGAESPYVQTPSGTVVSNKWTHLVGTFDGDSLRIYLNGVQQGVAVSPGSFDSNPAGTVMIGGLPSWKGGLALMEIHRRAWQALEVQHSFNSEKYWFGVWSA